jgi:predicted dehydrogenase
MKGIIMNKVKVAVIGFGHLGKWHTQKAAGLESSELVAIVEPFEKNQLAAKAEYPNIRVVASLDEVLDGIDAAVIVTPTSTHFELTKKLLEANKHVFCEKPLCSSIEQAKELKAYLGNKVLQVGHSERCHQAWELIKDDIQALPSKKTIKISRYAAFKGRATDVDVVQDLMIHDIDLMLFLFGEKPTHVSSVGHKIRTDKWDHVTTHFYFNSGTEVIITSGRNHIEEVRSLEIMSDIGCLVVDLFTNKIIKGTDSVYEDGSFIRESIYEKRDHLFIEQENFYNSILENGQPMVTYEDGVNAVFYISKVLESLDTSGIVEL